MKSKISDNTFYDQKIQYIKINKTNTNLEKSIKMTHFALYGSH